MSKSDPCGFEKAVNTKAIKELTPKQLDEVMKILAKVPTGRKR
jgi:hypothetical protein